MSRESPLQTAEALLPGLQYLAREALDAGLMDIAGIIGKAANDVIFWMHANESDPLDQDLTNTTVGEDNGRQHNLAS
ncbi:MAG: hypothetical protein H7841_00090 [Magnetospirillum sp. WYHS-4]